LVAGPAAAGAPAVPAVALAVCVFEAEPSVDCPPHADTAIAANDNIHALDPGPPARITFFISLGTNMSNARADEHCRVLREIRGLRASRAAQLGTAPGQRMRIRGNYHYHWLWRLGPRSLAVQRL
jgi:hypothetical protein